MAAVATKGEDEKLELPIVGMSCAGCVGRVERALNAADGVHGAAVNFALGRASITYDPSQTSPSQLVGVIEGAGYSVPAPNATPAPTHDAGAVDAARSDDTAALLDASAARADAMTDADDREERSMKHGFLVAAALTVPLLVVAMSHGLMAWTETSFGRWLQFVLATPVLLGPGRRFFRLAWIAAKHRAADMNTLIAIGTGAAWLYSTTALLLPGLFPHASHGNAPHLYFEGAAAVLTFVLLGKMLEIRARKRLADAVRGLVALQPKSARRVRGTREEEVAIGALRTGDLVSVRPGERIPADGEVVRGTSAVDESMLTGESLPIDKAEGAQIFGGTLNQSGALTFRVTTVGKGSALSRIVEAVEQAQGSKAPIARLADTVSGIFVPVVLVLAVVTFLVWTLLDPSGNGLAIAVERFVAVLVIACPCALGLATPAAVAVGTGRGAELGILVKGGAALEAASRVNRVLLDKTGTLTVGKPTLTDIVDLSGRGDDALLGVVASVENASEHPLARALVDAARERTLRVGAAEDFRSVAGHGVEARIDGELVRVGTAGFLREGGTNTASVEAQAEALAVRGRTPFFVAIDGVLAGLIAVADRPSEQARGALAALRELGIEVAMVTGDRTGTAHSIAAELGITEVMAEVKPEDKARVVVEQREAGHVVAMVGDGINDAPALAAAHVGIAVGSGVDVAGAAADIVLLRSGIGGLPTALRLGRATLHTIRQNLFWAFVYNMIGIPLAAGVLFPWTGWQLSPVLASAAMSLSSVSVLANSLRLRRFTA